VFRLPTEAEWEYACRAGSETAYYFGDNIGQIDDYAWNYLNSEGHTHPVGEKLLNAWGFHDMHGNVLEWCCDWFGEYLSDPVENPTGAVFGKHKVLRGGSWMDRPPVCRSADRAYERPNWPHRRFGFRIVRNP
jgi:formylglycine-generating enzyme required for sulfatase activity